MKAFFYLFASLTLLITGCHSMKQNTEAMRKEFKIHRGTNISHWLSQSERRGEEREAFFGPGDMDLIDSLGYDHIRMPVDEEQLWDEKGNRIPEAFDLLHASMDWAMQRDLRMILDLHIVRSHHFNRGEKPLWTDRAEQEKFLSLWRDLSADFSNYPHGFLAYEILNEAVADDPEQWNALLKKSYRLLRGLEPQRVLFIGSNRWQSTDTFNELWIPPGDSLIYLSFHFYHPMVLTHYRAGWTRAGDYEGRLHYPGRLVPASDTIGLPPDLLHALSPDSLYFDIERMRARLQEALEVARKAGLPLYCGEWGAYQACPDSIRLPWYRDFRQVLEENGIAWAHWDYQGGFGIFHPDKSLNQELIKALLE